MTSEPPRFRDLLALHAEKPAFHLGEVSASRGELARAAEAAAGLLLDLGLRRGDAIAVWLPDGGAWLQFLFAAAECGILMVPISTRYRSAEARHVLEVSKAKALIAATRFLDVPFAALGRELQAQLQSLLHVVEIADPATFHPGAPPVSGTERAGELHDFLCTFSTSGTTGAPKLAVHDQASCTRHARTVADVFDIRPGDAMLCALPLYGVLGFVQALAALAGGAACVLMPVFNAVAAAQEVERLGVTHVFGSDAMFDAVLNVPGARLSTLRGGGLAEFVGQARHVSAKAEADLGLRLVGLYGSSECFALMAARSPIEPLLTRVVAGGRPVTPAIEVRVADPETGRLQRSDETGELQIRGYNVMSGYLNNLEATRKATTDDGWFRTGDLGYLKDDGFVYLSRLGDGLRLRGYLVEPGEIENFLCQHPAIEAAQVVGVRLTGEGDVAVAFVRARAAISEAEVIAHCRGGIAGYKAPQRVILVDRFPEVEGPNGTKIQKRKLREMAATLLERPVSATPAAGGGSA
jgi:fatty-acyl-CoA synthase